MSGELTLPSLPSLAVLQVTTFSLPVHELYSTTWSPGPGGEMWPHWRAPGQGGLSSLWPGAHGSWTLVVTQILAKLAGDSILAKLAGDSILAKLAGDSVLAKLAGDSVLVKLAGDSILPN